MSEFWKDYPIIYNDLEKVRQIIKLKANEREDYFNESISSIVDSGGKMLRPALLIIASKFGDVDEDKIHKLAAVIEMIHIASLVHDDVIDDSKLRRGVESIQSKHGKEYAVYIGDYLFCQSFSLLAEHDYKQENLKDIAKTMSRICLGEIKQYNLRYNLDINLKNYIKIAAGKTATLFALSLYMGAKESNCNDKLAKNLARAGYNLGMAFQIKDDLLDYQSNISKMGKDTQRDLIRGYYTLPLIFALQKDIDNTLKDMISQSALDDESVKEIIQIVDRAGGTDKATEVMKRYTNKAIKNIEKLPDGYWKQSLLDMTVALLGRTN